MVACVFTCSKYNVYRNKFHVLLFDIVSCLNRLSTACHPSLYMLTSATNILTDVNLIITSNQLISLRWLWNYWEFDSVLTWEIFYSFFKSQIKCSYDCYWSTDVILISCNVLQMITCPDLCVCCYLANSLVIYTSLYSSFRPVDVTGVVIVPIIYDSACTLP